MSHGSGGAFISASRTGLDRGRKGIFKLGGLLVGGNAHCATYSHWFAACDRPVVELSHLRFSGSAGGSFGPISRGYGNLRKPHTHAHDFFRRHILLSLSGAFLAQDGSVCPSAHPREPLLESCSIGSAAALDIISGAHAVLARVPRRRDDGLEKNERLDPI